MKSINHFIGEILADGKNCARYCRDIDDGAEYLQSIHDERIEEELLLKLIAAGQSSGDYGGFLSDLAPCLSREEVTPAVFERLISFKGEYRESVLIGLGHCPLSYYQLIGLNELQIDEALSRLLIICMESDCFSNYDVQNLLVPWKNKPPRFVTDYICDLYRETEKGNFLQSLLT